MCTSGSPQRPSDGGDDVGILLEAPVTILGLPGGLEFLLLAFCRAGEADMSFALVGLLAEFFKSSCLPSSNVWLIRKTLIGVWIFLDVVGVTIFLGLGGIVSHSPSSALDLFWFGVARRGFLIMSTCISLLSLLILSSSFILASFTLTAPLSSPPSGLLWSLS